MDTAEQEALLASLREVGLGRYESAVYLGLLLDQTARVSEISKRTGVPQPKAYQALDSLVEKGFCTMGSGAVNRYRPVPPRDAMVGLLDRLAETRQRVQDLGERLEEIRREGQGRELWAPPIEIIKGLPQVERLVLERLEHATDEALFFARQPHLPRVDIAAAITAFAQRGGRVRMLVEPGFLEDPDFPEECAKYRALPADFRMVDHLPTKMIILDRHVAVSSVTQAGGKPLDLVVRHRGFVDHFVASFERSWSMGKPLVFEESRA